MNATHGADTPNPAAAATRTVLLAKHVKPLFVHAVRKNLGQVDLVGAHILVRSDSFLKAAANAGTRAGDNCEHAASLV